MNAGVTANDSDFWAARNSRSVLAARHSRTANGVDTLAVSTLASDDLHCCGHERHFRDVRDDSATPDTRHFDLATGSQKIYFE
jgi:hypothetical protein